MGFIVFLHALFVTIYLHALYFTICFGQTIIYFNLFVLWFFYYAYYFNLYIYILKFLLLSLSFFWTKHSMVTFPVLHCVAAMQLCFRLKKEHSSRSLLFNMLAHFKPSFLRSLYVACNCNVFCFYYYCSNLFYFTKICVYLELIWSNFSVKTLM
jgi:hypothetical protein